MSDAKHVLGVCDVSRFQRFGVKGPNAAQWLAEHGIALPQRPNAWVLQAPATLVLRLGNTEFLLEDQGESGFCATLAAAQHTAPNGVFPVQRYDLSVQLSGNKIPDLLSELCTLDLREKTLAADTVVMTQVADISATVLRQTLNNETVYRLWCDGTYGVYMWETLVEIAQEHGGGVVDLHALFN